MRRARIIFLAAAAATLSIATSASGYYHFLHFQQTEDGLRAIPERFDRDALVDDMVYFYVSAEQRPQMQENDSFNGLVSQVRQALATWDAVPTSHLRVGFGGVVDGPLQGSAPAAEVVFAELPPGVLGMGGPTLRGEPGEEFVPIQRSQVIVPDNLAVQGGTTFSEGFYNTLVHEIGHALGLQHSLAGSAMSMEATRSTTRARPLDPDDVAGLSALYPTDEFWTLTGAIEGTVLYGDGTPVVMASVAAVNLGGRVVTALTAPDGVYRIEGLLPGDYTLYVQPMPRTTSTGLGHGNNRLPVDEEDREIPASGAFRTVFLGDVDRPEAARFVPVVAASVVADTDFRVERRENPALLSVTTYSFPGYGAPGVHPAFLNITDSAGLLVATGPDLVPKVGAMQLTALFRDVTIRTPRLYEPAPSFVQLDVEPAPFAGLGPLHLMFRLSDDIHILPGAAQLTNRATPIIYWLTPDFSLGTSAWRVAGQQFGPRSQVYFDGLPGRVLAYDSITGELVVEPPVGPAGHRAVVTVYNPDGQSSAFALPDGNVMFPYPEGPTASAFSNGEASPSTDHVVEISGLFTQFAVGEAVVGFGSSDIVTRDVQVLDEFKLRAVVSVGADAEPGRYDISVSNGLETIVLTQAFRVRGDGDDDKPALTYGGVINAATSTPDVAPGTLASLYGLRLARPGLESAVRVTLGGLEAPLASVSAYQINLQIPDGVEPGLVELRVFNGAIESELMLVPIGHAAPGLFRAVRSTGEVAGPATPLLAGSEFTLVATGFGTSDSDSLGAIVVVNGFRLKPISVTSPGPGIQEVTLTLPEAFGAAASVQLQVLVAGRLSNVLRVPVTPVLATLQ